jgi:hypothetical protein
MSQGEKFDPRGDFVRRWCPELKRLSDRWLHQPWQAPAEILARAGVELGHTYPRPIVSHAIAREVALEAFSKIRGGKHGQRDIDAKGGGAQFYLSNRNQNEHENCKNRSPS